VTTDTDLGIDPDLLPDDLNPATPRAPKGAVPVRMTRKQQAKAAKRAAAKKARDDLAAAQSAAQQRAARLAQIVNLHIAGHSLADIGASIGMTAEQVDAMLMNETARYVRTQPALRTYVRNWISSKYTDMLDADMEIATDANHSEKLDHQDRVIKILKEMGRLHGAAAPTQTEIKIEAAPESVERMVAALAASAGQGYDASVFDVIDVEVVHEAAEQAHRALEVSGNAVEQEQPDDRDL
jgi:hypothetical protein